jgi:hypothetical protein
MTPFITKVKGVNRAVYDATGTPARGFVSPHIARHIARERKGLFQDADQIGVSARRV